MGCLAVAVFSACSTTSHLGRNEIASQSPRAPEIRKTLNETAISEVDLENVTVGDAMKAWAEASRLYRGRRFGFEFVISPTMLPTQSATQGTPSTSSQSVAHITVRRKNITSARLLDEICQQSNSVWLIMGRVIVIKPRDSTTGAQP